MTVYEGILSHPRTCVTENTVMPDLMWRLLVYRKYGHPGLDPGSSFYGLGHFGQEADASFNQVEHETVWRSSFIPYQVRDKHI
jgi:hypothetical protein